MICRIFAPSGEIAPKRTSWSRVSRPPRGRVLSDLRRAPPRRLTRQRHRSAARHRRAGADHPGDDALVVLDEGGEAVEQGRLARAGAARDHDVAADLADDLQDLRALRRDRPEAHELVEGERVITCEDAAELQLQQPHVVRLETRPPNLEGQGQVTMRDLVKNCLRMRPERTTWGCWS
jgi:hypothetical protein